MYIDLNSDLGESFGAYTLGMDEDVLAHVTSANIATGWHAGDPLIMERTVALCKEYGVAVGAHPGYPDLVGFGRRKMDITPQEARAYMLYQLGALHSFAKVHGVMVQHMKLHGAFYNTACVTPALADAIIDAMASYDTSVALMVLSGSYIAKAALARGLPVIQEVFADRGYTAEGTLVPRSEPGAFIKDVNQALERVLQMIEDGTVMTADGQIIPIIADSVCVHGDNPEAVEFTQSLREGLERAGISVCNFQQRT